VLSGLPPVNDDIVRGVVDVRLRNAYAFLISGLTEISHQYLDPPIPIAPNEAHSLHSTLRERVVEHVFVGEALRWLWRHRVYDVEVLRSEFDAHGYDLVMARGRIARHIQFKTGTKQKPLNVSVSRTLAEKPSGCVIWICVTNGLDMGPFFWFAGEPGRPPPPIDAYATPLRPKHFSDQRCGDCWLGANIPEQNWPWNEGPDVVLQILPSFEIVVRVGRKWAGGWRRTLVRH
jgi:hypothetical protein